MLPLRHVVRRLYSSPSSDPALVARTASTPLAVRLRRRKKFGAVGAGLSDATPDGLTPTEKSRYDRLKALGKLEQVNGNNITEAMWLSKLNERRSRVRGLRTVKRNGMEETEVLGKRIYLPNIIIRLVRNHTLPGAPYNPYEATFRIPKSVTKTDLRSYLLTIYGVKTTYIRTDNYISRYFRTRNPKTDAFRTYKRAVVGLVDPFYYPHRLEDMNANDREAREKWVEENFRIQEHRADQKYEVLKIFKKQSKGWKFNEPLATRRKHILRLVAERREKREGLVDAQVHEWQQKRERNEEITI